MHELAITRPGWYDWLCSAVIAIRSAPLGTVLANKASASGTSTSPIQNSDEMPEVRDCERGG